MPRRFLFAVTLGISLGTTLGEYVPFFFVVAGAVLLAVLSAWIARHGVVLVLVMGTLLGVWRFTHMITTYDRSVTSLIHEANTINGLVIRVWPAFGREMVEIGELEISGERRSGSVQITTDPGSGAQVGVKVAVACRWAAVQPEQRLSRAAQGRLADCRAPEVLHFRGQSPGWRAWLARVRASVVDHIKQTYHSPQSDLLAGILLGVQETMTTELRQSFRATGTSHIVALSGFNVTIIITILAAALSALIGRRVAFWPTTILIICFVVLTGASASVTRAAVMSLVGLVAGHLGRPVAVARIILYAFVGMVLFNPLILLHDLGFQLSFLATLGLIYVSPSVERLVHRWPEAFAIRSNLSSTLAAMLVTEPLLLWLFGRLSIVAPAVNLAVLPLIPFIMAFGAVALVVPWAVPVTDALLRLVLGAIDVAAAWPVAQVDTPWWLAGGLAGMCVWLVIHFVYASQQETPPRR